MNVLLISVNKEKSLRPVLPCGMAVIASVCEKAGHNVKCVDLCFVNNDKEIIEKALEEFKADIAGISIRNIDNQSFFEPVFYPPLVKEVVKICRKYLKQDQIFLGGAGFSLVPEKIMEYTQAGYGIKGEGEFVVPQLLDALENGKDISGIPGLVYYNSNGRLVSNQVKKYAELDKCVFPDYKFYDKEYFQYRYNTSAGKREILESIQTKRGCNLSCIYCSNCLIEGNKVRERTPAVVVDEMERIKNHPGCAGVEITDGVFNIPYLHSLEIVKEMKRRNLKLPWYCMLNPGTVTEELISRMKETGCAGVEFGTDSGSDRILKKLNKNYTVKDIINAHNIVYSYNIKIEHCIFFGAPGETREDICKTIDLMERLSQDKIVNVFCTLGFRVFPGIPLYETAVKQGVLNRDSNYLIPKFYCEPAIIDNPDILDYIEEKVCQHKNWYLWWELPYIRLKDKVVYARKQLEKMEMLNKEFLGHV